MKRNNNNKLQKIGLTGGIGAGKSTVSARFAALGAHIIDADSISRNALRTNGPCYEEVISLFGHEIVQADGSFDRAAISSRIFADESLRLSLNSIVHPYVLRTMHMACNDLLSRDPDAIVIFDIPLLFECGADADMDCVIVVTASDDVRIERICKRDATSREKALSRIEAQIPQHEQAVRADFVIDNSGTLDELFAQIDAIFSLLRGGSQ